VHLSEKAVDPPGEARADLEIFLDSARRMGFRNRDGAPLIPWSEPEEAFEAWKACSRGRPCDYSELSYDRLREEGGVQWGGERLYAGGAFNTDPSYSETFGHDMETGAAETEEEYRAKEPGGRAFLHAVPYRTSPEVPGESHPLLLTTGRSVYLMACECDMAWTLVGQAARGLRDTDLFEVVQACETETATQLKWLKSRMKEAAPQALVVAP
jgi:anaerobic selenocysteine-containing dehydrogenase